MSKNTLTAEAKAAGVPVRVVKRIETLEARLVALEEAVKLMENNLRSVTQFMIYEEMYANEHVD